MLTGSAQYWSHLSDTRGRRPVLLIATLLTALAGMPLGFPRSFLVLFCLRILVGLLNGQSAMIKNYLSEICDETNEASAFAIQSLSWQIGWCASAVAGGYLAHAERTFPSLEGWDLVMKHPYALPFLVVAIPPVLAVALGYFVLPETKPQSQRDSNKKFEWPSTKEWTDDMWRILKIWGMMVITNTAFQAVIPLFLFAPVAAGGLGAPTSSIGQSISLIGFNVLLIHRSGLWYAVRAVMIIAIEFPSKLR